MRNKVIILSLTSVLFLGFANLGRAQDVYVDMSALDALSSDEVIVSDAQPLFPVVKSSKIDKVKSNAAPKKAKVAKKKVVAKVAPKKVVKIKEAPLPVDSIFKPAPAEVKDVVSAAPVTSVASKVEMNNSQAAPLIDLSEKKVEVISDEWVEVVDVEPVIAPVDVPAVAPVDATAVAPAVVEAPIVAVVDSNATKTPIMTEEIPTQLVSQPVLSSTVAAVIPEPVVSTTPAEVVPNAELLLDTSLPSEVKADTSNSIVYEEGVSELTPAQQQQIDVIISKLENPQINKIAIFSYNLDDGKDVFRKKRLSLNRAVDVRSYLLQKGYKNFSIKVINVDEQSDKINEVEIQELK